MTNLCPVCVHVQRVTSNRGSVFLLCRLSASDERFPRYPPLPVRACIGFREKAGLDNDPGSGESSA